MPRRARTPSVVVIAAALLVGVAIVLAFALRRPGTPNTTDTSAKPPATAPDPKLSPGEVVLAVLAALKDNGPDDAGIRTTFRFASPANQSMTGPVERFVAMVKQPPYDVLINHRSAGVRPLDVIGGAATALVTVTDRDGNPAHFLWQLSKQPDGPAKDCWLTDGVTPVRPPPTSRPTRPPLPAEGAEKA